MGRRKPRVAALLAALLAVGLFGLTWWNLSGDQVVDAAAGRADTPDETAPAPTTTTPDLAPKRDAAPGETLQLGYARAPSSPAIVADATVPQVGLYNQPGDEAPAATLDNPTWEGLAGVYLVMQEWGDWLEVQVSMRPNEATAWIKKSDVSLREATHRIVVDLSERRLTAFDGDTPILDTTVAVGTGSTPTPTGNYFVDGTVKIADPTGPYGAYQLSVAAFSDVHQTFGGGIGQIALHGTNDPALLGTPASNGCVRMTNDDVTLLANTAPTGTPVQIIA